MKFSFYWLLITSSLVLPLSCSFSTVGDAVESTLRSNKNFQSPGTFTSRSTSNVDDTIYNLTNDATINNAKISTTFNVSCIKKIDISKFELSSIQIIEPHFGYPSIWANNRKEPRKAVVPTWEKTGYIPHLENQTSLVPNMLWGAFIDIRSLQQLVQTSVRGENTRQNLWGAGLSNFFHRDHTKENRGFRHVNAGYAVGITTSTFSENIVSLTFCQLFGKDKDHFITKNDSQVYAGSFLFQHIGHLYCPVWFLFSNYSAKDPILPFIFNTQLSYSYTSNNMKIDYFEAPQSKSTWSHDCFALEFTGMVPTPLFDDIYFLKKYTPFLKVEVIYAHQEKFKERGNNTPRVFESSNLINVALPLGITFEGQSRNNKASYDTTVMYIPDIYRKNPDCTTSFRIKGTSWETLGTNLSRRAAVIRIGQGYAFTPNTAMFSKFTVELRGSSQSYTVNLGSKLFF
ncbi:autotransporter outer membrane beta-barrel domain-containing protein [Candidatus Chlamydia sanziniae]|uniref:Outer membrane protein 5 n=1 Tax=Candidatus Chlamydia sanziniae TaxID=1806891 RepID=A0A1A9HTD4_9CHLA|nr:autotransporter outer membrane beta-barrel domain-containing protein [Candidatus Chlamydia sanziniae]ANH78248.1 outer membrane protein 5 [Candidatus Chlamydia sanziniae]